MSSAERRELNQREVELVLGVEVQGALCCSCRELAKGAQQSEVELVHEEEVQREVELQVGGELRLPSDTVPVWRPRRPWRLAWHEEAIQVGLRRRRSRQIPQEVPVHPAAVVLDEAEHEERASVRCTWPSASW